MNLASPTSTSSGINIPGRYPITAIDGTPPAFGRDADLALNTDLLAADPEIATLLHAAGFENKQQPGRWEDPQGIALDLMVAPHQSNRQSATARAANLGPHSKTVARIGPGLAPALTDNKLQVIEALDPVRLQNP